MILVATVMGFGLALAMSGAWLVQHRLKNAGWVDVIWTFATGVAGVAGALLPLGAGFSERQILVAALVGLWSLRLGIYLAGRVSHGPEDVRYAALRQEWGENYPKRMFGFLQIQAAAAWLLSLSVMVAGHNPKPGLGWQDAAGVAVLLIAIAGEGLADAQMRRFKADPANRGKVCNIGLWAWSRHPNYFFEWLGWVAYPLFAISLGGDYLWGFVALTGPAFMYWLLVHVSGIPMLEEKMIESRGEAYRAYQKATSAFFPLPPKSLNSQAK